MLKPLTFLAALLVVCMLAGCASYTGERSSDYSLYYQNARLQDRNDPVYRAWDPDRLWEHPYGLIKAD